MFADIKLEKEFKTHATLMQVKAGDILMHAGQYVKFIPIIVKGCIRVLRQNDNGDETFLYHLMPGETCALSLTCCSTQKPSEVKTIAENDTELWSIPIQCMDDWQQHKEWRNFVALTYQTRFHKLLLTIDDIAFQNMDERLWKYLKARAETKPEQKLHISHEEIAEELNVQRESVTRLIKKLKDLGYIKTSRNLIQIVK